MPVYSLVTYAGDDINMNICTYVTAVSMKPKLFLVAVDYSTQTFENLKKDGRAILQILHSKHSSLINLLGKKSGKSVNKQEKLANKNLLTYWKGNQVLDGACGYLQLKLKDRADIGGDHELCYFEVETSSTKDEKNILMFQDLIKQGLIL